MALSQSSVLSSRTSFGHSRHTVAGPRLAQRPKQECCAVAGGFFGGDRDSSRHAQNINRGTDSIDLEWKSLSPYLNRLDDRAAGPSNRNSSDAEARTQLEDQWEFSDDSYTPFPSNLPTTDSCPAPSISGTDIWSLSQRANYNIMATPLWGELTQVYVILFGVGETDTEGIYSLRALPWNDALPQDTIIAFEEADDAARYAGLLEASGGFMEHAPNVCPIEPSELLEFCQDSGYSYRLEPRGSLLIPPDYNIGMTDWERSVRLRDGKWSVLDNDPAPTPDPDSQPTSQPATPYAMPPGANRSRPVLHNNAGYYAPSESNLDELKARLERLLRQD